MAATTTKAKKPSKIRRSIVGPLRGRSARICDRPALRWQAAVVRRGDLRGGAPPGCVQDSLTQRREGGKRETHTKTQRRSEEHTSELQSLMRISYAVFCLKKKKYLKKLL